MQTGVCLPKAFGQTPCKLSHKRSPVFAAVWPERDSEESPTSNPSTNSRGMRRNELQAWRAHEEKSSHAGVTGRVHSHDGLDSPITDENKKLAVFVCSLAVEAFHLFFQSSCRVCAGIFIQSVERNFDSSALERLHNPRGRFGHQQNIHLCIPLQVKSTERTHPQYITQESHQRKKNTGKLRQIKRPCFGTV